MVTDESGDLRLTESDLQRLAQKGVLNQDQILQISALGRGQEPEQEITRSAKAPFTPGRLNLPKILAYIGAILILLAFTIFVGRNWQDTGTGELVSVFLGLVFLLGLGLLLRLRSWRLPGDLLLFAAIGMVPLIIFTIIQFKDFFPADLQVGTENFDDLWREIRWEWLAIEVPSVAVFLLALAVTRFSLYGLLVNLFINFVALDATVRVVSNDSLSQRPFEVAIIIAGLFVIGVGLVLDRVSRDKGMSFWFYLFGLVQALGGLGALLQSYESQPKFIAFFFASLFVLVGAAWLKKLVWAVVGSFGILIYVSNIANVFEGSDRFTFSLAAVGLVSLIVSLAYAVWGRRLLKGAWS